MEIKRNEATLNRPEGDRVLDAPYVFIDIDEYIEQIKDEKAWNKKDRNAITVFKGPNVTVVISALQSGAEIVDKTVDGFMTIQILKGKVQVTTPDGDIDGGKRNMVVFHPGVPHSIKAESKAILLITNYNLEQRKVDSMQNQ